MKVNTPLSPPERPTLLSAAAHSQQPNTSQPRSQPDKRGQPLLIKQWKYLWREEFVELRRDGELTKYGWCDEITADGTTIWIHLSDGKGRVMIHQQDGIDIWRVDPRICRNRSEPGAGQVQM
jgi:hypothetical protein